MKSYLLKSTFFVLTGIFFGSPTLTFAQYSKKGMKADNPHLAKVVPVAWSKFKSGPCVLPAGERFGKILLNANKYALNTWWQANKFNQPASDGYLDFHGKNEHHIRPAASEAQGLAISLQLGLYNSQATGVSKKEAKKKTIELIRSLVHRHVATAANGWGSVWQSPLWASRTAMASWLMWDQLDAQTRKETVKMLESEAVWVMSNKGKPVIKTYRNRSGKIISPGDTGSEENAWDSDLLVAATAMLPGDVNYSRWMNKVIELELATYSRPSDVERTDVYNGKPLSGWLPGSNANEDGTVINHNIVHPDYMTAGLFEFTPIVFYSLARLPVPKAGMFNCDIIYNTLANLQFTPGKIINGKPATQPGGTMFIARSAEIYYPQGDDWGTGRRLNFAMADAVTSLFSPIAGLRLKAAIWERKHTEYTLMQQARFEDGHTYLNSSENKSPNGDSQNAMLASRAYLLHWLAERHAVTFTNKKY